MRLTACQRHCRRIPSSAMPQKNLHILLLRGYRPFGSIGRGGHTQEVARALALYSSIPEVLIPRMERYQEQIKPYASLSAYHKNFPKGLDEEGEEITITVQQPIYNLESLGTAVSELFVPLCTYKKHATLLVEKPGKHPAEIVFVKKLLDDIDHKYKLELPAGQQITKSERDIISRMKSSTSRMRRQ